MADTPMPAAADAEGYDLDEYMETIVTGRKKHKYQGLLTLTRRMDDEPEDPFAPSQLDVDLMMLDCVFYKGTRHIFEWRASLGEDPHLETAILPLLPIDVADGGLNLMRRIHGDEGPRGLDFLSPVVRFRLQLFRFSVLFTHCWRRDDNFTTPETLARMRSDNSPQSAVMRQYTSALASNISFDPSHEFPVPTEKLKSNRFNFFITMQNTDMMDTEWAKNERYVSPDCPYFSDLLYSFMSLTAARINLGEWIMLPDWFEIAAEFMLQAAVEEYFYIGASGVETLTQLFGYGCPGETTQTNSPEEEEVVKTMETLFGQEGGHEENPIWTRTRDFYLNELLPNPEGDPSSVRAIWEARERYPAAKFEETVMSFLELLHESIDKPDLIQWEQGQIIINGRELSAAETQELRDRVNN